MKILSAVIAFLAFSSFTNWETDFSKAKETARSEHKYILLNFSGSDWCGPCIKLHREYFGSEAFASFAKENLIMVNADFPRQKKNQLPKNLQQQNDHLADQYNSKGDFPLTVLISPDGKMIKEWEGFPKMSLDAFIDDIKNSIPSSGN